MLRNRFVPGLAIAALAGVLMTAGCVSAATNPPAAAATASARVAAATGGTANIMIYGVNTDGAFWHAILSGVIGDYGPAVSIYPDGQVDPAHNSELDLRLTDGSFRLSIAALDKAFVKASAHAPIYRKTCTDLISVTGTMPIVAGSGTGAYHGIAGRFPVTLMLNEVEARPCRPSPGAFRAQLITVASPIARHAAVDQLLVPGSPCPAPAGEPATAIRPRCPYAVSQQAASDSCPRRSASFYCQACVSDGHHRAATPQSPQKDLPTRWAQSRIQHPGKRRRLPSDDCSLL